MTSKKLLKILLLFIMLPLVLFTIASGSYLFFELKQNKLDAINNANKIYMTVLVNEARYPLSTRNVSDYQSLLDVLVEDSNGMLLSIELFSIDKKVLASSPANPDVSIPAIRVPVYISETDNDLLDVTSTNIKEKEAGYILIRYNNNLPREAINKFAWLFGLLFMALLTVIGITLLGLRHHIYMPINRVFQRIEGMINDDFNEVESRSDYLSGIDHGLNILVRKLVFMQEYGDKLKEELKISRSRVDMNNVTKVLVVNDLISRIDQNLSSAREIMMTLVSDIKDPHTKNGMKIIASYINDMNKTIRDASKLMERIGKETTLELVNVQEFYNGILEFTNIESVNLVSALLCSDRNKQQEINIDSNHMYQLIGLLYALAVFTSGSSREIYLTVRIEYRNKDSYTITVDIKDTGAGLDSETINQLNMFLSNKILSFQLSGFPIDDLQMIKYLSSSGGILSSASSEKGRGTHYTVTYDREQIKLSNANITKDKRIKCAILHNGIKNHQLKEHYHSIGIDIEYILLHTAASMVDDLASMDFVIVEFTNEIEKSFDICKKLLAVKKALNIIPAYSERMARETGLQDRLFDLNIRRKHIPMPYGASGIIEALRERNEPVDVIDKIIQKISRQ